MPDREVLLQLAVTRIDELKKQIKDIKKGNKTTSTTTSSTSEIDQSQNEDGIPPAIPPATPPAIPPAINCDEVDTKQENSNDAEKTKDEIEN